jgi:hypothetical protein
MRNARVAIALAPKINDPKVSDNFWREIQNVPWIDKTRTYAVNPRQGSKAGIVVTGDPSVPAHHYTRRGNTLLVPPAVVQSFAAAFIADDLKGTPPPNGRR